jgi:hypothetical protein
LPGLCLILTACDVIVEAAQGTGEEYRLQPAGAEASALEAALLPTPTLAPDAWMSWPVLPKISETALEIYRRGFEMGNNPHAFSKVGDCQNVPSMFMAPFDDPRLYRLGEEYADLDATIEWFAGSFSRESLAVRGGFNAASVLSPFWANPEICERNESPLECEYRVHKPIIAIISLETWWDKEPEEYEAYLRSIIEITIEHGVVPILTTKADNLEGGHRINGVIARLGYEYDIPVWNFWAAVQDLPGGGLLEDGFHLTFAANQFDDPERMLAAWPWRNLTGLQSIHSVWESLSAPAR